jgi:hypothetical protein
MAYWASLRCARFVVSIAGGATTGLHGETRINDESYAIALAFKTYGARTTLLDKRPDTMDTPQYAPNHTSSDLLFSLDSERARQSLNYEIVAQSAEEVQDTQNAPAVSMGPYLIESGQTQLLTTISI